MWETSLGDTHLVLCVSCRIFLFFSSCFLALAHLLASTVDSQLSSFSRCLLPPLLPHAGYKTSCNVAISVSGIYYIYIYLLFFFGPSLSRSPYCLFRPSSMESLRLVFALYIASHGMTSTHTHRCVYIRWDKNRKARPPKPLCCETLRQWKESFIYMARVGSYFISSYTSETCR